MSSPRLLLLEDDPVVARFVTAALAPLALTVEHVADLAAADAAADAGDALWLFDARLPDGLASTLLPALRARGLHVPALALTADDGADASARLRAAGFARVLTKPIPAAALRAAVQVAIASHEAARNSHRNGNEDRDCPRGHRDSAASAPPAPRWDDAAALAALGDAEAVRALRRLFLDELPAQRRDVLAACAAGDADAAGARLHRLKAGCAFVGAAALAQHVHGLAAAPADAAAQRAFADAAAALLDEG